MDKLSGSDLPFHSLLCFVLRNTISSLNATDKTPVYEMLLIYVFGGLGFGVGFSIFVLGFKAFCPEIKKYVGGYNALQVPYSLEFLYPN